MTQSVGIIGHGLTGITAAIMLARAGYQVDLIGPKPKFSGGLQLAPNGLAALQTLGHYEAVRKKRSGWRASASPRWVTGEAWQISRITTNGSILGGAGRFISAACQTSIAAKKYPHPCQPGCPSGQFGEKMEIFLENGRSVHADEIIGADGANGLCRSFVAGARLGARKLPIMRCAHRYLPIFCRACFPGRKPS